MNPINTLRVSIATVVVLASAVGAAAKAPRPLAPGLHKVLTGERVSGVRRSHFVRVPAGSDGSRPLPVVLAVHGAFSPARDLDRYTGLSRIADREGFLVVYPQGIGLGDLFRHWNSGHCCGNVRWMTYLDPMLDRMEHLDESWEGGSVGSSRRSNSWGHKKNLAY